MTDPVAAAISIFVGGLLMLLPVALAADSYRCFRRRSRTEYPGGDHQ